MFVIQRMFIEDKNLSKVLIALAGLVVNMDAPQPVVNAVVKKGKLEQETSGSSLKDRVIEKLRMKRKGQVISSTDLTNIIAEVGGTPASKNYIQKLLFEEKFMKSKERGSYVIL